MTSPSRELKAYSGVAPVQTPNPLGERPPWKQEARARGFMRKVSDAASLKRSGSKPPAAPAADNFEQEFDRLGKMDRKRGL